jgi:hypothetical protein
MIRFSISPKVPAKIAAGYKMAELVLNGSLLLKKIGEIKKLTYTEDYPSEVIEKLVKIKQMGIIIPVEPYFYKNSSVIGMTKGDGSIYVNLNGFSSRRDFDYLANGLHEFGHYPLGYGHGSNFPNGWRAKMLGDFADKRLSVPYQIAEIGSKIFKNFLG